MKRALLRNLSLYTRNLLSPPTFKPNPNVSSPIASLPSTRFKLRFYSSSENDSTNQNPKPLSETNVSQPQKKDVSIDVEEVNNKGDSSNQNPEPLSETNVAQLQKKDVSSDVKDVNNKELKLRIEKYFKGNEEALLSSNQNSEPLSETNVAQLQKKDVSIEVEDVNNKELKLRIEKYFKGDEEALPSILEAILMRKLTGKHEDTDDELMDDLQLQPLDDVKDKEFESDFEELYETDEEIEDLYNARQIVEKRMVQDEYFNMDDRKWDEMIKEATEKGFLKDTGECERILEDMLSWDKLLPDEIKKKVEEKFDELGDMCERGELEPEEAYELFKEFEDKMVMECAKMMEAEGPPEFDDTTVPDNNLNLNDPPGEGPILRWKTRVVFAPGGDAFHPKNRKVKMAVTVKELGLSKHQFRRLRELVGKRYHPGRDELTITSERFEHREENRKDCLRTLFSLVEECGKANKLAEDARASYVKDRLRANPEFMERLQAKTTRLRGSNAVPV